MTIADQIKELRAEYVRIGYIVRGLMEMPVPRNRKAARAQRIQIIRKYEEQQDAIYAQMVELQKAGA